MTNSVKTNFSLPLIRKDITMSPASIPALAATNLDLNSLRLPPNYGATLGVKKVFTTITATDLCYAPL